MKILVIEDEKELSTSITFYLRQEGYVCEPARNFEIASEKALLYIYDCIIVDIMLPDGNGLDIIRMLKKEHPECGVIIISAKNAIDDKITGLNLGADDYLTKPFHLSELSARIKSILRRRNFRGSYEIKCNELKIIPENSQVFVCDSEISLTKKEFDLLIYFVANKDRVITKESIAEHLWGDNMDMADSFDFIYTHIKNLRKKIMEKGGKDYIRTVYKMGYKFTEN
jgi:DNA-binding response OmpR family regulator